jgi:probable phosphoglycerate mutase
MATRLYLVRHGATQLTAEDRFSGAVGVDLSKEGRAQVKRLAKRLADETISAVYCSPLSRTVETASILAEPHELPLIQRDGLKEISHGRWEGLTRPEVEAKYPGEYASWEADPFTFAPQDGESGVGVLARALPVIRQIVVAHAGQNVLVVSHKATLRILLSSLLGFDRCAPASCCSTTSRTTRGSRARRPATCRSGGTPKKNETSPPRTIGNLVLRLRVT